MKHSKLLGGILLVAGTTIGAGMLALPISTGIAGFYPALLAFLIIWGLMLYTAFLMLEVNLYQEKEENLITMAEYTLGGVGKALAWSAYLFLLYLLNTAYISLGSDLLVTFLKAATGMPIPSWLGPIPFLMIFGYFVYQGTSAVDHLNRALMVGLAVTYFIIIIFITPHVDKQLLEETNFAYMPLAFSVIVTSFGYHIIIPTLTSYFKRDLPKMKTSLFIGSIIPFLVYILWEFIVLGVLPMNGSPGLTEAWIKGTSAIKPMQEILQEPWISVVSNFLAFFAIVTSFLGVSLSLTDFLADGLKVKKTPSGKLLLACIAFLPPLTVALTYPRAFLTALEYAGAFGVITLLCLLPAAMVWSGRYKMKVEGAYQAPGGKAALIMVFIISIAIIAIEMVVKTGILSIMEITQ
ncbi:MAG: amino acid permease [Chlamydiota bacterium]